jgi:hypothetical protein
MFNKISGDIYMPYSIFKEIKKYNNYIGLNFLILLGYFIILTYFGCKYINFNCNSNSFIYSTLLSISMAFVTLLYSIISGFLVVSIV